VVGNDIDSLLAEKVNVHCHFSKTVDFQLLSWAVFLFGFVFSLNFPTKIEQLKAKGFFDDDNPCKLHFLKSYCLERTGLVQLPCPVHIVLALLTNTSYSLRKLYSHSGLRFADGVEKTAQENTCIYGSFPSIAYEHKKQ